MYQSQFGLDHRPFSSTPDPGCVVPVGGMSDAVSELQRCASDGQGIGILTAPAGLGKTVLCRKLAESLRDEFAVVFLPNANFPTRRSLLQALLYEMGHPYLRLGEQELRLEFATAVRDLQPDRNGLVVIIDEAHLLHNRLIEELRTATHLVQGGEMLVRLILSAQLDLEERLVKKDMAAINQRIVSHVTLASLTMLESEIYLQQRIAWAGGKLADIFAAESVRMICQASDGNPRCLNQLADHGLLFASSENAKQVSTAHVLDALDELKQLPLQWNHVEARRPAKNSSSHAVEIVSHAADSSESTSGEPQTSCFEFGADEDDIESEVAVEGISPADLLAEIASRDSEITEDAESEEVPHDLASAGEDIEISWDEDVVHHIPVAEAEDALGDAILDEELSDEDEEVCDETPSAIDWDTADETEDAADIWTMESHAFEVENVEDHYALLDSGIVPDFVSWECSDRFASDPVAELRDEEDAFAVPPMPVIPPEFPVISSLPKSGEEWQPEDLKSAGRNAAKRDPSELIDQVMPLLELAISHDGPDAEPQLSGTDDVEDADSKLIVDSETHKMLMDVSSEMDSAWENSLDGLSIVVDNLSSWNSADDEGKSHEYLLQPQSESSWADLEQQIAQTVLETYSELQPLIWSSTTESEPDEELAALPRIAGEEPIRDPGDATPFEELRDSLQQAADAAKRIDDSADEIEAADAANEMARPAKIEYDIVMPETDDVPATDGIVSRTDLPGADDSKDQNRRGAYNNLFSRIRRKEQA